VSPHRHSSREVTPELVERAERIFCMTRRQCEILVERFPAAASKVRPLDPQGDIEDPSGQDPATFLALGARLQELVRARVSEMVLT
jgi:protein-tyrosine-phosphatase